MKSFVFALVLLFAGCSSPPSAAPDFFVAQSTLTDCGKASAAMLVNFAGGQSSVAEATRLTRSGGWWTIDDIERHLVTKGIPYKVLIGFGIQDALINGGAVALLTNIGIANHWVVAYELRGDQVRVADPLFGMRWQSVFSLDQQSVPLLVKVERKL